MLMHLLDQPSELRGPPANSHAGKGWEEFTGAVIKALNEKRSNLVFLLWGNPAQKRGSGINAVRATR